MAVFFAFFRLILFDVQTINYFIGWWVILFLGNLTNIFKSLIECCLFWLFHWFIHSR